MVWVKKQNQSFRYMKMSQKFCIILVMWSQIIAVPDAFAIAVKLMSHTGLWHTKFSWCFMSTTHWIYHYDLEHSFEIHGFRPTWPCMIIKILATWAKFLKPSGYCIEINCTFPFPTKSVFGCFCSVIAHFELIKHKFPN